MRKNTMRNRMKYGIQTDLQSPTSCLERAALYRRIARALEKRKSVEILEIQFYNGRARRLETWARALAMRGS